MADCGHIRWWNKGVLCRQEAYKDCPECVSWWAGKLADSVSRGIAPATETGPTQHPLQDVAPEMAPMLSLGADFEPSHALVMSLIPLTVPSVVASGGNWRVMTHDEVADVEAEVNALALPDDPLSKHRTLAEFYAAHGLVIYALHSMAEFAAARAEQTELPDGAFVPDLTAFLKDEQDVPIPNLSDYPEPEQEMYTRLNAALGAIRSELADDSLRRYLAYAECLYRFGQPVRAQPALESALQVLGEQVSFS